MLGQPRFVFQLLTIVVLTVGACAPRPDAGPGAAPPSDGQSAARKVLTLGIQGEPPTIVGTRFGVVSGGTAFGGNNVPPIAHDELMVESHSINNYEPQLAIEKPSIEKGTWRLSPDGSMELTWRVHPNVKWHDGTPFTTNDLLFTFEVFKDPDIASTIAQRALVESATAPDPTMFVVRWSKLYANADQAEGLQPLPRHLVEDLYRADREAFVRSPVLGTEFVGLGPYKLVTWQPGSHIEFARHDDYYLGRPPFDTVIVRFLGDPNTMVANILAGTVDGLLPRGIDLDQAVELRQRWEGTGHQVITGLNGGLRYLEVQHRAEYARPANGITEPLVRQALYHATDRSSLAEVATAGLSPIADSWIAPGEALRPDVDGAIPQYPFYVARGQQLLAQAGWTRGADGFLARPNGERFDIAIWARQEQKVEKELNVIADTWKSLGARPEIHIIPPARANDREYQSTRPGFFISASSGVNYYENRLHSNQITSAANRWAGFNRGGHNNPTVDSILDRLAGTIDPRDRIVLHRQLIQEAMGSAAVLPLYWEVAPVVLLKGVKGHPFVHSHATWKFYLWDKE